MKKRKNLKGYAFLTGVYIITLLLIGVVMLAVGSVKAAPLDSEELSAFATPWQLFINDVPQPNADLTQPIDALGGDTVTLCNILPDQSIANRTVFFRSVHKNVKVYADGNLLYSYGFDADGNAYHHTIPPAWHTVRIPNEYLGKELRITFTSSFNRFSSQLSTIYIGTKSAAIFYILITYMPLFLLGVVFLIVGATLQAFGLLIRRLKKESHLIFDVGLFSVATSLWVLSESKFLQLLFGNMLVVTDIAFLSLSFMILSFLLILHRLDSYKTRRMIDYLLYLNLFIAFFVNVLYLLTISGFYASVFLVHLGLGLTILCLLLDFIRSILRKTVSADMYFINCSLLILLLFSVFDLLFFYLVPSYYYGVFSLIGITLFIVFMCLWAVRRLTADYVHKIEVDTYKKLAYSDSLTGVANRTAFENTLNHYRNTPGAHNLFFAVADINDLKSINDTYGHQAGDRAICAISSLLSSCFDGCGKCYRIGGDEFCVIAEDLSPGMAEAIRKRFYANLDALSKASAYPLQSAYGYSWCHVDDRSIELAFKRADDMMYQCKYREKSRRAAERARNEKHGEK